jgi:hypothetical protein
MRDAPFIARSWTSTHARRRGRSRREEIMGTQTRKPIAIGLAAAIALGSGIASWTPSSASAAPLASNQLAVKEAAPDDVIDVRRWRRHHSGAAFAGLALGVIGAIIAHEAYRRHHRRHYYYAPHGYYGYYGAPACIRRHGLLYCR